MYMKAIKFRNDHTNIKIAKKTLKIPQNTKIIHETRKPF